MYKGKTLVGKEHDFVNRVVFFFGIQGGFMVHQYKLNGFNIVLDTCSGGVHVVDEVAYDMIALYPKKSREEIVAEMQAAMKQAGVAYATEQIIDLIASGVNNIHIYTMNKPDVAESIMTNLSDIIGK